VAASVGAVVAAGKAGGRAPKINPARSRKELERLDFGQLARAAARNLRESGLYWLRAFPNARATTTWLAIVTATYLVQRAASSRLDNALLLTVSTNLHNLARQPVSVLITSACFISSTTGYYWFIAVCVFVLAPLENWIGTGRWLIGLLIGHVGSTLLVALGLAVIAGGQGRVVDVGVSYGVRTLAAIYVYRWTGWQRWVYAAAIIAFAASQVAINRTFTDWGHCFSVLGGVAIGPVLIRGRPRPRLPFLVAMLSEL